MKQIFVASALVLFSLPVSSLSVAAGDEIWDDAAAVAHGASIVLPFKRELQAALRQGLAEGLEQAIRTCRLEAPRIASALSTEDVQVGRTSHKLRNPRNAPKSWMVPLLAEYRANPKQAQPRAVSLENGRVGYAEPIFVQPPCLTCHGEDIPQPVQERLAELYPEDRATGFRTGDFRGMFWAEFPDPD
jgi:hypothetical protein